MFDTSEVSTLGFGCMRFNGGKQMPGECIRCGACEEACPPP